MRLSQLEVDTIATGRKTFERTQDLINLNLGDNKISSKDGPMEVTKESSMGAMLNQINRDGLNVSESKPALKEVLSNADFDLIHQQSLCSMMSMDSIDNAEGGIQVQRTMIDFASQMEALNR